MTGHASAEGRDSLFQTNQHYMHQAPTPMFITAAELRKRWIVSGMFLHRMRKTGKLSVIRIGKRGVRFALSDILKIEAESVQTIQEEGGAEK